MKFLIKVIQCVIYGHKTPNADHYADASESTFFCRGGEYTRDPEPSKVSQQPASDQEKTTGTRDEPTNTWAEGAIGGPV